MEIISIFAEPEKSKLWTVCYPEDTVNDEPCDIFSKLLEQWNDTEFLQTFFTQNAEDLANPFWDGLTIDGAIDLVIDDAAEFEELLWCIETKQPSYESKNLKNVFEPLHNNIYSLSAKGENYRKGKPENRKSMLRLYAIELEDGIFVITGGGIKLTRTMEKDLENEIKKLNRVRDYLKSEGISDIKGLIT